MVTKKALVGAAKSAVVGTYKRFLPLAGCGCRTKMKGKVTAFGEEVTLEVPFDAKKNPYVCLDCLASMSIVCTYCLRTIFPYETVTLYAPDALFEPESGSVTFGRDPIRYVGCMRNSCLLASKGYQFGIWLPNVVSLRACVGEIVDDKERFLQAVASSRHYVGPKSKT